MKNVKLFFCILSLGISSSFSTSCSKDSKADEIVEKVTVPEFNPEVYLDRAGWTVTNSSLAENNNPASNVLDDNDDSIWHTSWTNTEVKHPHFITIKTGPSSVTARGITLLHRPNSTPNGKIKNFKVEISENGEKWTEVFAGETEIPSIPQTFKFINGEKTFNYIKVTSLSDHSNQRYASLAEINLNR